MISVFAIDIAERFVEVVPVFGRMRDPKLGLGKCDYFGVDPAEPDAMQHADEVEAEHNEDQPRQ